MDKNKKLWLKLNPQVVVKLAGLCSNALVLSTNAFLLGSSVRRRITEKKTENFANKLQLTAEVASAISGVAKVVAATLDSYEKG
jgi:hypothetical protein